MLNRRTLFALLPAAPLAATMPAPKAPLPPLEFQPVSVGMPISAGASAVNSNMRIMQRALKAWAATPIDSRCKNPILIVASYDASP